ncbi:MAG: DUF131 domain-containing protein [Candidatus Bathyarchaeia archaeon]
MNAKICEICGKRQAKYVCQECGRKVCEQCIEPYDLFCLECYRKIEKSLRSSEKIEERMAFETLPVKVFFLGFLLIFVGMLITFLAALLSGLKNSTSLFLLIGPIPIILGAGEHAILLTIIAAIVTIMCVVIFVFLNKRRSADILGGSGRG